MKRSSGSSQTLDLNRVDFERAGSGRKAGYKFTIEFTQGRVANIISGSPLASDLATVLLNDPASRAILATNDINVSLNTKFQLSIVNRNPQPQKSESSDIVEENQDAETIPALTAAAPAEEPAVPENEPMSAPVEEPQESEPVRVN